MRRVIPNLLLVLMSLAISIGIFEAALLVIDGFHKSETAGTLYRYEDVYISDRPLVVDDLVRGYRRLPGKTRIARIIHDTLVFDHAFMPNNEGYISARDYVPKKASGTTRLLVFGDSFTAGEFLRTPWPDRVNELLQGRTKQPMELYSFAVNGGGLGTWHDTFFKEIVPRYDFDAVVFAIFGDDLARGYVYLHYEGSDNYIGYFPKPAASEQDFIANYLPRMRKYTLQVGSDAEIDAMIASVRGGWHWPGLRFRSGPFVLEQWRRFRAGRFRAVPAVAGPVANAPTEHAGVPTMDSIEAKYGAMEFGLFREMMDYCRDHGIPVILASVPRRDEAHMLAESQGAIETPQELEVRALAEQYRALYLDGHALFAHVPPEDIDGRYWLKYDAHWNQAGSDLFAQVMSKLLIANQDKLAGSPQPVKARSPAER